MRFMIVARSQFQVPMEMLPAVVEGFVEWWNRYQDKWESAGFYAGVNGGGGICNVADEVEFNRMMMEWPLMGFSEVESHPLVDMNAALSQWKDAVTAMPAGHVAT